jgi:alpha-beta hydrolase superfamily lysophospholipase
MEFEQRREIQAPSGATLNLHCTSPGGAPRAIIQINHGLAEHSARYERFAQALARRGYAVYAHDHRGHGLTKAPDAPLGSFGKDGARKVIADVLAVHQHIRTEQPSVPVIIFGHSMGALIALNFVQEYPEMISAAAIWNGNFSAGLLGRAARALLAWERFRIGSDVPSRLLPKLTFDAWGRSIKNARTPFDWLSRDQLEVDTYIADPLCGRPPSVGMWIGVFDFIFAGADSRNLAGIRRNLPFHVVGGAADPATDHGAAVQNLADRIAGMGFSNLVSKVYPDTRHESLNELNRDIIIQEFIGWLDRTVATTADDAESS